MSSEMSSIGFVLNTDSQVAIPSEAIEALIEEACDIVIIANDFSSGDFGILIPQTAATLRVKELEALQAEEEERIKGLILYRVTLASGQVSFAGLVEQIGSRIEELMELNPDGISDNRPSYLPDQREE